MQDNEWLSFLKTTVGENTHTTTTGSVRVIKKTEQPLLTIPALKLYELYKNLQSAGFTEDEAILIVVGVANGRNE